MIDVGSAPAQLRAAVLAMKAADRDLKSTINKATRTVMSPVWRDAVAAGANRRRDQKVLATGARIKAGNPPAAVAATSRRRLRGGLVPGERWPVFEFGANRDKVTTYTRTSPNGTSHQVTRRTARQLPPRRRTGHVIYPAVKAVAPRVASLWVQIIVREYYDAAERK